MSRIGKQPISIPDKAAVVVDGSLVRAEGPLGKLELRTPAGINVTHDANAKQLVVNRVSDAKPHRELHGLFRTLISNMLDGVTQGYKKSLELIGIGYSITKNGNTLAFELGYANTVTLEIPGDVAVDIEQATNPGKMTVSGCDKQRVGQFAARVRAIRPPEPYQGKGIRYAGEEIRRKAGKAFTGVGT